MSPQPFFATLRETFDDLTELVRAEGRLARAETSEKIESLRAGVEWGVAALLAALIAAFVLVQAAIVWLAQAIGLPAATLTFGIVFLVVGLVMLSAGRSKLRMSNLRPHRTIAAAHRSAQQVKDAI